MYYNKLHLSVNVLTHVYHHSHRLCTPADHILKSLGFSADLL